MKKTRPNPNTLGLPFSGDFGEELPLVLRACGFTPLVSVAEFSWCPFFVTKLVSFYIFHLYGLNLLNSWTWFFDSIVFLILTLKDIKILLGFFGQVGDPPKNIAFGTHSQGITKFRRSAVANRRGPTHGAVSVSVFWFTVDVGTAILLGIQRIKGYKRVIHEYLWIVKFMICFVYFHRFVVGFSMFLLSNRKVFGLSGALAANPGHFDAWISLMKLVPWTVRKRISGSVTIVRHRYHQPNTIKYNENANKYHEIQNWSIMKCFNSCWMSSLQRLT